MARPSLGQLQRRFAGLVAQPEPVEDAARALRGADPGVLPLRAWTARPEGLGVYAGMYFARLRDVLRDEFERVVRIVGDASFARLAAEYLQHAPPSSPALRDLGDRFSRFLAGHPAVRERPDLADLARVDRARAEVLDAEDSPLLDRATLERLPPAEWPALLLRLAASVQLLELDHAVDAVWLAADREEPVPPPSPGPSMVLVWRRDFIARHRAVAGDEREALRCVGGGASFAEVCGILAADRSPEEAAALAHALLLQWLVDGILVSASSAGAP